jgi:hypothetical protein
VSTGDALDGVAAQDIDNQRAARTYKRDMAP